MKTFIKIFGSIFAFFICVMLIVWLIRLSNNKTDFIGISALYTYIQSVNILKPFNDMINSFTEQMQGFQASISNFGNIADWSSFWSTIGNFMPSLWNLLSMPIQVIYYIGSFIVNLIIEVTRFFRYVINY